VCAGLMDTVKCESIFHLQLTTCPGCFRRCSLPDIDIDFFLCLYYYQYSTQTYIGQVIGDSLNELTETHNG